MLNFLGVESNFSVLANTKWESTFRFVDSATGETANLDALQFLGAAYVGEGDDVEVVEFDLMRADNDAQRHVVYVSVPPMPEGRWPFSIYATNETGERMRLIAGYVTAVGKLPDELGDRYELRTLMVRLPGDVNRHIQLEWAANSVAQQAAETAREEVKKGVADVKTMADKWLSDANSLYNDVKAALEKVQEIEKRAEDIYGNLDELKGLLEEAKLFVESKMDAFLPRIGEDGYWYRGTECLYVRAEGRDGRDGLNGADGHDGADGRDGVDGEDGEPGKSPLIQYVDMDVDGEHYEGLYWFNWNNDSKAYEFSKTKAEAKDGMPGLDADYFRCVYVESTDDLPEVGDKNVMYFVPQYNDAGEVELYHTWRYLEHADGSYQWHNLFDTPTVDFFAQRNLENVEVLAGDYDVNYPEHYVTKISWVRRAVSVLVNSAVTAINKLASVSVAGLIKLGTSNKFSDGGWLATNEDGQGVIAPAQTTRYGVVKPSTSIVMTAENAGLIGMSADGKLMTYRAGYQRFGGVALSTQYEVTCNAANYCVTIPVADGKTDYNQYAGNMAGAIIFNLASGSCLRYNAAGPNGTNKTNSMWLAHDDTLKIDAQGRLSLNQNTINTLIKNYITGSSSGVTYATQEWVDTTWYNKLVSGTYNATNGQYKLGKWIDDKLKSYATTSSLSNYVTTSALNTKLNSYVTTSSLSNYVTTSALNTKLGSYATTSVLAQYVKTTDLNTKLSAYATQAWVNAKKYVVGSGVTTLWVGTLTAYNNLASKSSTTAYLCKE